ncbi:MAG TPA: hypothetical protein PKI06_13785, partial [Saprospiraceae bacterium]|nr:hypothetical protein [Saprospiraceae bacterium]
ASFSLASFLLAEQKKGRKQMSDLCSLNNSLDAIGDVKALIVRSINFSYFLWPKSNKKTCRKKAIFASQNHG